MQAKRFFMFGLLALTFSATVEARLTPQQDEAKTQGLILYNQYKAISATPFLAVAAEAGDHEAQYYLAESLRKKSRYMDAEAQKWYEASAAHGDIYAMIRLGRSNSDLCQQFKNCPAGHKTPAEWLVQADKAALLDAEKGDPESMYLMYEISLDRAWLEKSANAGYSIAQYWMAVGERQGEGFFLLPGKRQESVRNWLKRASEGGYPVAMMDYLQILFEEGDMEGIRHWLQVAAETGEQRAVSNYGAYIAHMPDKVGYPLDLVKGYALFSLLKELDGGGNIQDYVQQKHKEIAEKMTAEQIENSKKVAQEWKVSHPPLSFFPDKLSR
jgi:TPR repeat protein